MKQLTTWKKIGLGLVGLIVVGNIFGRSPDNRSTPQPATASQQSQQQNDTPAEQAQAPVVETKTETKAEPVAFESTTRYDSSITQGTSRVTVTGSNGERTIVYKVVYTDGKETARTEVSNTVTKQPVNQVTSIGTKAVTKTPVNTSCSGGYINSVGNCVRSPGSDPSGASAKCRDGSYSYSQSRSGTCSHHGGVARWL